jgi:REP element-mobilizing transposase RayT
LRSEWEHLWKIENERERRKELEAYLDKGRGECPLKKPRVAEMVEGALRFFHRQRYELQAWVLMANHVHVLFRVETTPMSEIVEDWKKYTAHEANKLLGRQGRFWEPDYWDTYMRDTEHELKTRRYVENNPSKAGLVLDPKAWTWSSARFRDEFGTLRL